MRVSSFVVQRAVRLSACENVANLSEHRVIYNVSLSRGGATKQRTMLQHILPVPTKLAAGLTGRQTRERRIRTADPVVNGNHGLAFHF